MKNFKKYYIVSAPPEDIYRALTTEITIRLWTGDEVEIDPREGGEFATWDGAITGKFIELDPFKKIAQQWYFGAQDADSIVTIKLHEVSQGSSSEVQHTSMPDDAYADVVGGGDHTSLASLIELCEGDYQKNPLQVTAGARYNVWRRRALPPVTAVASALAGLTALFGMG